MVPVWATMGGHKKKRSEAQWHIRSLMLQNRLRLRTVSNPSVPTDSLQTRFSWFHPLGQDSDPTVPDSFPPFWGPLPLQPLSLNPLSLQPSSLQPPSMSPLSLLPLQWPTFAATLVAPADPGNLFFTAGPFPTGPAPLSTGPSPLPTGSPPHPTGPPPLPTGPPPLPTGPPPLPTGPPPLPGGYSAGSI